MAPHPVCAGTIFFGIGSRRSQDKQVTAKNQKKIPVNARVEFCPIGSMRGAASVTSRPNQKKANKGLSMNRSEKASVVERIARDFNKGEENMIRVQANTDERGICTDEPILRFSEFLRVVKVGRSKAYDLMNPKSSAHDSEFPTGFPLFDSPRSPKGYWRHEAIAWARGRSNKFRNQQR